MARVVRYYASVPSGSPSWFTSAGWYLKIDTGTPSRLARNDTRLAGDETIIFNADTPALGTYSALAGTDTYQFQLGFEQDITINDQFASAGEFNIIEFMTGFRAGGVTKVSGPGGMSHIEITIMKADGAATGKKIKVQSLNITKFKIGNAVYTADGFVTAHASGFTAAPNIAPVLADISAISVTDTSADDTFTASTGTFTATDANSSDTITFAVTFGSTAATADAITLGGVDYTHKLVGTYGTLYYNDGNGKYRYEPNAMAVNALKALANETDAFSVVANDGKLDSAIKKLVVTITGANDAPEIMHQEMGYNAAAANTEIILNATHLLATDPDDTQANITFTLKSLPVAAAGKLQIKAGGIWADAAVNDTFTGADLAAGKIKFVVGDAGGDTSFTFTIKDDSVGTESSVLTFTIDERGGHTVSAPDNDNRIDLSSETEGKIVDAGDGKDTIIGGQGNDQITGGLGDDEIDLGADGGSDEVVYELGTGSHWTGKDGGDTVKNFKRGQDKLTLKVGASETTYTTLEKFLLGADGADDTPLTGDDQFIVTPDWVKDGGAFYVTGITFHFREAGTYGTHKIASGLFKIEFAERMPWNDFVITIGGASNFDAGQGAIKKLVEVDPNDATKVTKNYIAELLGQDSIDFSKVVNNTAPTVSGSISTTIIGIIGQTFSFDLIDTGKFVASDVDTSDRLFYSIVKASDNSAVNWLQVNYGGVLSFVTTGNNATSNSNAGAHTLKLKVDDGNGGIAYSAAFTLELGKTVTSANALRNPFTGFEVGYSNSVPYFVDIDSDGDMDLVSGNYVGKFNVWRKDATGYTALTSSNNPFNGFDVGYNSAPVFVDLDGDDDMDLVSGKSNGQFAVWRKDTNGYIVLTGSDNPLGGLSVGFNAFSTPTFVDLDGDGDLDLVSGEVGGTFKVWRKDATSYTALTGSDNPFNGLSVSSLSTPNFMDIDGDGDMDLVSGERWGKFYVWRMDTNGYTQLTGNSGNNANPLHGLDAGNNSAPVFVDLDGDGDLDLVSGNKAGVFKAWFKLANGSYSTTNDALVGSPFKDILNGTSASNTLIGGAENDVLDGGAGKDMLTGGAGNDIFVLANKVASVANADVITDFTNDDKLKFSSSVTQVWFTQTGTETLIYDSAAKTNVYGVLSGTHDLTMSDILGSVTVSALSYPPTVSGSISDAIAGTIGQTLSFDLVDTGKFVTSDGDGDTLTYSIVKASDNSAVTWLAVDLDGVLSFASGGNAPDASKSGAHSLKLKVDDGNGGIVYSAAFTLELGKTVAAPNASANPFHGFDVGSRSAPSFVDIDGDGDLDLVSGERWGKFKVWRKDTNGYTALTGSNNPLNGFDAGYNSKPVFVDIDGYGNLVSGERLGTFKVWRKDTNGYTQLTGSHNPFNGFNASDQTYGYSTPSLVDLDGDGDLDLVSGNYAGRFVVWRKDTAGYSQLTGNNNPFNGFDVGARSKPAFVDLDGDGDLDLVSGNETGTFKVWRNDSTGSGNLISYSYTELTGSNNPFNGFDAGHFNTNHSAPVFVDIDGDGDLDLVTGNYVGQFKVWFKLTDGSYSATNDALVGTPYNDALNGTSAANTLIGGAGDDGLNGGAGNDVLVGNAGADTLTGGAGNDIFVLDIATTETKDAVTDFGTGTDKIRVDTTNGNEATLTALRSAANLRWTNTTNEATGSSNDASTNDTVIYNTKGTANTSDDVIIMVIEDYTTALTISDFDIV